MKIRTYFEGSWHEGSVQVMSSSDHGIWLGTTVFDGARYFEGVAPDLDAHCARVNRSAEALMLTPSVEADAMVEIVEEGLKSFSPDEAVYIRPMYWGVEWGDAIIAPKSDSVGFAIALEAIPLPSADSTTTLGTTQFRRPVLADNVVNAKAGCLYPNNARMLSEARAKGFGNALVADAMGKPAPFGMQWSGALILPAGDPVKRMARPSLQQLIWFYVRTTLCIKGGLIRHMAHILAGRDQRQCETNDKPIRHSFWIVRRRNRPKGTAPGPVDPDRPVPSEMHCNFRRSDRAKCILKPYGAKRHHRHSLGKGHFRCKDHCRLDMIRSQSVRD